MECIHCLGLMGEDNIFDFEGTHGFMWRKGWRCLNCGHAEDSLIAANHCLHEETMRVRPSGELANEREQANLKAKSVTCVVA